MSTAYAPVPAILPATITLPQDLVDQRTAASVNVPFASLADAIAYLGETITLRKYVAEPSGVSSAVAARTITPLEMTTNHGGRLIGGDKFQNVDTGVAQGKHMYFSLSPYLTNGSTLVSARISISAVGSGHIGLPAYMPAVAAFTWQAGTGSLGLLSTGFTVDTSASIAAYEATHNITVTFDQNNVIDTEAGTYWFVLVNEGSTNAQAGLTFDALRLTMTAPRYHT